MFSLLDEMAAVQKYRQATEAVLRAMPDDVSIVSSSILSALAGHYGDYHATPRTWNSRLWINPLMPVYWCFRLPAVAQRVLYLDAMRATVSYEDVRRVIRSFRSTCVQIRPREAIPV